MTAPSRIRLTWVALVLALVSLAALAVAVPLALAQDAPGEVEVVGVIATLEDGTTITVNELRIETTGAEIKTPLTVGAAVKVEGTLQPDGTIRARQIMAAEDGALLPGEIEIVGALQVLTPNTAVVNGIVFNTAGAEVQPGLAIGVVVKVHARLGDGGVWIAREIERFVSDQVPAVSGPTVQRGDDDLEIVGTLDEIGEGYVVVAGQRFDTTGAEIKGQLIVGALVKIELTRLDSGVLVAREIKLTTFSDDRRDDSADDGDRDDSDDDSAHDGDSDDSADGGDSASVACAFEVKVSSANVRSGPGTGYDVIGFVFHDQKLSVVEVDVTGTWIKVALPDGQQGWVAVSVGELDDDCSGLPVSDDMFKDDDHSGDDGYSDDRIGDDDHSGDDGHSDDRIGDDDHSGDDGHSDDRIGDDDHSDDSGPDDREDRDKSDDDHDDDHKDDHKDDEHDDD